MKIDDLEKVFKAYVDDNKSNLTDKCSIDDMIERHNISIESGMCKNEYYVRKKIEDKFKEAINLETGIGKSDFRVLKEQLLLKKLTEERSIITGFQKLEKKKIKEQELYLIINEVLTKDIYITVLEVIFFYSRNDKFFPDIKRDTEWNHIIILAIDLISIRHNYNDSYFRVLEYEKTFNVAYAANYFISKGHKLYIENNKVRFVNSCEMNKVEENIEKEISEIGGWNVCEYIFKDISQFYDEKFQRYNLVRQPKNLPKYGQLLDLQKPWGYLLNLSLKHFNKYTTIDIEDSKKRIKALIDLATCYIAIFKFQKFSIFEGLFISVKDLPFFIQDNIFYDRLFTIRQWKPSLIEGILNGLFCNLFKKYYLDKNLGYSLDEYIKVTKNILKSHNSNFKVFYINDIKNDLKEIEYKTINRIIDDISHKKNGINSNFLSVDSRITFYEKPLIRLDKDRVLLINASWCSFGFVEMIQNKMREILKEKISKKIINLESLIGIELESFIKNRFVDKGIKFRFGYYGKQEECDLILEDKNKIVFIEVKKKVLTEEAQRGNDIKFFDDIAKSLISSQAQLLKHEGTLLKNHKIELRQLQSIKKSKGMPTYTLNLNNRKIKKISLSLGEYGFLNSKETTRKVLEMISISKISTVDPSKDNDLNETREYINKMNKYIKNILDLNISDYSSIKDVFENSFFMSVNFFLSILENSFSKEEFLRNLFLNERILTGSSDQYFDYSVVLK